MMEECIEGGSNGLGGGNGLGKGKGSHGNVTGGSMIDDAGGQYFG